MKSIRSSNIWYYKKSCQTA